MKKLADFIVKYRKIILVIFVIITVASAAAIPTVYKNVNSDLTKYLPEGTKTSDGQKFLSENFGINGDCAVGITGASEEQMQEYIAHMEEIEGVTQIMWRNSDMFSMLPLLELALRGGLGLEANPQAADEMKANIESIDKVFYNAGADEEYNTADDTYLILMTLDYGASTNEAFGVLTEVSDYLSSENADFTIGGMTQMTKSVFDSTVYEVWKYTLAGIIVVLVLLFLFTESWVEPIVLLMTLGISIVINMGTNIIMPSTSIITFSASAILQLGLSMDYAIFFLHALKAERKHNDDFLDAVAVAIPKTFSTVIASALTTLGGFIALFFMRFSIGADLGGVLAKGIVMSMLTVVFFEPAFVILFRNKMDKWTHKNVQVRLRKPIKLSVKYRTYVVIAALVLLLPAMLLQSNLPYGYLDFVKPQARDGLKYEMVDVAANQIVIAVPFDSDNAEVQYDFIEELKTVKNSSGESVISFVLGLNAMLPEYAYNNPFIYDMMMSATTGEDTDGDGEDELLISGYINNGFTMYTVGVTTDVEGDETFAALDNIEAIIIRHFGEESGYKMVGMSQAAKDFADITPTDFTRVSIASLVIIFVILLVTFRSVKHSALLLLIIQMGIWINLAFQKVLGSQINFMSYLIISSIQMGSTVDYAILIANKYRENRKKLMPSQAAYQATASSVMSVITSCSILAGACITVYFITSNLIVAEITMLIARGAIICALLTLFILPAVLAYFDRPLPSIRTWSIEQSSVLRKTAHRRDELRAERKAKREAMPRTEKQIAAEQQKLRVFGKIKKLLRPDDFKKGSDEHDILDE